MDSGSSSEELENSEFAKCHRGGQQRRNTDFSQADNDLKRFLEERNTKRIDSDGDLRQDKIIANAKRDIFPTRVFGSVEKLEDLITVPGSNAEDGGPESVPRCGSLGAKDLENLRNSRKKANQIGTQVPSRRFRMETTESCSSDPQENDLISAPVIENPEHQTMWYSKYFLGKFHHNYVGQDGDKSTYVLSVVEEKSFGKAHCRCILWTKDGPKRLVVQGAHKTRSVKTVMGQLGLNVEQLPKEINHSGLQKDLFTLEKQERAMNLKFGVIYAKKGQLTDDEFFSNESGSTEFENFLNLLGGKICLKGWDRYRGGLDVHNNMTGTESVFTLFEDHQIMFHVSQLLPFSSEDTQQVERKRHIGNDIVNIIFMDGSPEDAAKFQPQFVKSHFTHIHAVVCYIKETDCYTLTMFSDESVPLFGPLLSNTSFNSSHQQFRRLLLTKCINGEKATYKANVFSSKRERTYEMLLQDMYDNYWSQTADSETGLRTNSGSIKLYGHQRKAQEQMDSFVKVGQALRLESRLTGGGFDVHHKGIDAGGRASKSPWEPQCIFPNFPHRVLCGDSWGNRGLFLGTSDGLFLVTLPTKQLTLIFDKSVGIVVQLHVIETYGIMVMRALRHRGDGGKLIVMRLNGLEEYMTDLIAWQQKVDDLLHNESKDKIQPHTQGQDQTGISKRPHWEPRTKVDLRSDVIESSKGCTIFTISRAGASPLRLACAIGRRAVLMRWRHHEEWISLNTDTANGFELEAEVNLQETPTQLTLLGGTTLSPTTSSGGLSHPSSNMLNSSQEGNSNSSSPVQEDVGCYGGGLFNLSTSAAHPITPASPPRSTSDNSVRLLVGSRHHFDLVKIGLGHNNGISTSGESTRILTLASGSSTGAISATEIFYDQESEALLSHNCSSHVQKVEAGAAKTHPIEWNSVPLSVICAFPYILAFSTDAIEFRYAVNGSLLQTLCMPELKLISAKDDLYLCSTKQPVATRKPLDGGYQDLDYRYLYKIPWPQLVGGGNSQQQKMAPQTITTGTGIPKANNNNHNITK